MFRLWFGSVSLWDININIFGFDARHLYLYQVKNHIENKSAWKWKTRTFVDFAFYFHFIPFDFCRTVDIWFVSLSNSKTSIENKIRFWFSWWHFPILNFEACAGRINAKQCDQCHRSYFSYNMHTNDCLKVIPVEKFSWRIQFDQWFVYKAMWRGIWSMIRTMFSYWSVLKWFWIKNSPHSCWKLVLSSILVSFASVDSSNWIFFYQSHTIILKMHHSNLFAMYMIKVDIRRLSFSWF